MMKSIWTVIQTEQKRRAFLQAGRELLQTKTIPQLKVSHVVKQAELAQGTFYNYFSDKNGFIIALMEEICQEYRISSRKMRTEATDAKSFCEFTFQAIEDVTKSSDQLLQIVKNNKHEFKEYFYIPEVYEPFVEDVIEELEDGIKRGYFVDHDCKRLAWLILCTSIELIGIIASRPNNFDKHKSFYVDILSFYFTTDRKRESQNS